MEELCWTTLENYREYAESIGVIYKYEFANSSMFKVNREALSILLAILLSNAIGVTPAGATVRIKGAPNKKKTHYVIAIADGGDGIPPWVIEHYGKRKIMQRSKSITDLHGMRRYGNGLIFASRLEKKTNIKVGLYSDKVASASLSIPLN
jgi:K+-sensing histidine kinase KdpD